MGKQIVFFGDWEGEIAERLKKKKIRYVLCTRLFLGESRKSKDGTPTLDGLDDFGGNIARQSKARGVRVNLHRPEKSNRRDGVSVCVRGCGHLTQKPKLWRT